LGDQFLDSPSDVLHRYTRIDAVLVEQLNAVCLEPFELIRVLKDWCQPFPGFFLYYPSRRQQPARSRL
jgi:hypothetical protein